MDAISITVDFSLRAAPADLSLLIESVPAGTIQATNGSEYRHARGSADRERRLAARRL